MTETAFLQYTGYVLAFFAVWIVARCARSMLSERYVPEVWGYLELPDGTSRAIEHWECILGRAKASDIVLTGEGIERSHAAIQRSGAGEWTLSALDGGRGVWLNGKAVTGDAPLRGGDTLKLGEMELHFLALDDAQRKKIAAALSVALSRVFPDSALSPRRLETCFSDAVSLCRLLRSEDGRRFRTWGSVLSPFKLDATLHAHMMPAEPPTEDIANDAHAPWASIWAPDEIRHDSFDDLFAASVSRSEELMTAADSLMKGRGSYAALRSLHGGLSYDSGLPWQETCPPSQAPGVKR